MPLLIIVGIPSSGKTTRSNELISWLIENNHFMKDQIFLINEESL